MISKVILDKNFTIGEVDPRLFGGFVEHLGRHIYTGIYEPSHPTADSDGFRTDVIEMVKELAMPVMRYPGGNFVSGYNWEDGVGPKAERPVRLDLAWNTTEPNEIGTNEFVKWCRKVESSPMLAVNLGTRGAESARNLVEYCNYPSRTAYSDLRREHGYLEPHCITLWCLGNEMDGSWQMGHKTAEEYGRVACEAAKLMKLTDPSIELVVCGSSGRGMPSFMDWEQTVLEHTYDHVDYLSIHTYFGNPDDNTPQFLARPDEMDSFIDEVAVACDAVAAKRRKAKRMMLSFDEWNVWYHSHKKPKPEPWSLAPRLLEDDYTFEDALCVGGMLISLINHSDRVKIGCMAQVVNVIAPIMTEPNGTIWRQTIFHPFALASRYGRGMVLKTLVDSPNYEIDGIDIPFLKASAVWHDQKQELVIFLLNRNLEHAMEVNIYASCFGDLKFKEWILLQHDNLKQRNTADYSDAVKPVSLEDETIRGDSLILKLPAASWSVVRLGLDVC